MDVFNRIIKLKILFLIHVEQLSTTALANIELGLAVDILQCWNVNRTVRKKDFVFLARVRVSRQYFPVLYCVSYSCARKRSLFSLFL